MLVVQLVLDGKEGSIHVPSMTFFCILTFYFFRSVTLVGEADRKMLKAAIKHASGEDMVRHRQIPADTVAKWAQKLDGLKAEISAVMDEEREEKEVSTHEIYVQLLTELYHSYDGQKWS